MRGQAGTVNHLFRRVFARPRHLLQGVLGDLGKHNAKGLIDAVRTSFCKNGLGLALLWHECGTLSALDGASGRSVSA